MPISSEEPTDYTSNLINSSGFTIAGVLSTNNNALTVLNPDHLLTLNKPNAIVRPIRRTDQSAIGNSDGGGLSIDQQQQYLHHQLSTPSESTIKTTSQLIRTSNTRIKRDEPVNFSKDFDSKMRRIQSNKKYSSKNSINGENIPKKPLFITTVPTGVFLKPSRELPIVSSSARHTYSFFSVPRILTNLEKTIKRKHQSILHLDNYQNIDNVSSAARPSISSNSLPKKPRDQSQPQNIMFDRRVIRGTNYGLTTQENPGGGGGGGDGVDCCNKEAEAKRRQLLRKHAANRSSHRGTIGTPPPFKGRKHENVQTEKYLEELLAKPPEFDAQCQTDLFLQRPPSPKLIPCKTGIDVDTEIMVGDLFNFDTEVNPMIESLVGRSVEHGLMEMLHEEELADLRRIQQEYLAQREAELAEVRYLKEEDLRLSAEKARRENQERIAQGKQEFMQERITAAKLLQGHVADLLPGVLDTIKPGLNISNWDNLEYQLEEWLAQEVAEEVGQMVDSRDLLEEIVREILVDRAAKFAKDSLADDLS